MAKVQRFLFSFPKFINYLKNNQHTLNLYGITNINSFSEETIFHLDDKWYISEEGIHGQSQHYFLVYDDDMVIAYGNDLSTCVNIYYLVNPDNDRDICLIRNVENSFGYETLHPIKYDVFKLIKEHGEVDREDN